MATAYKKTITRLLSLRGERAQAEHLKALLLTPPRDVIDVDTFRAALAHGFAYYYRKWDPRGRDLLEAADHAVCAWSAVPRPDLNLLCEIVDFLYFTGWCFDESSTIQSRQLVEPLRAATAGFAKTATARKLRRPRLEGPYRIAWIAMFAQSNDAMTVALRHVAPALRRGGHDLHVYAWRFIDDAVRVFLTELGVSCHDLRRGSAEETILATEARGEADQPDIVISDMNNAVPTALFSRQLAPVQLFLQAGMPAWPVANLHGVFNSFGFDPAVAGWGDARMLHFNPPWDLSSLNPPVDEATVAAERERLPKGVKLIGSYGRFAKITRPYLEAAEQILQACPEAVLVLGGTGNDGLIKSFMASSPVGDRIHVEGRFVPGHAWGHLLHVMLDTWPVTGGESCREVIAKGRPVVTHHSAEMPAIDLQRDAPLVNTDWRGYVRCAVNLIENRTEHAAACARASAFASKMSEPTEFERVLNAEIADTVRWVFETSKISEPTELERVLDAEITDNVRRVFENRKPRIDVLKAVRDFVRARWQR